MGPKSPLWTLFHTDGKRYRTDRHHNNAWCKACLEWCEGDMRKEEIAAVAQGAEPPPSKNQEVLSSNKVPPIAGKIETMRAHSPPSPLPGFEHLPSFSEEHSFSPFSTRDPSPAPSMHESTPASKRRRLSYAQSAPSWSTEQQAEFGADLCKLFVTCGWSWNAVANPELKLFFEKYLPAAELPDRRVLSGSILKTEANKVIVATRQKIQGKLATYSEDGWKNIAHTHVDTSMLNVEGRPYLLRTHDMTGRPKTGDELFEIMKSDFEYAWNTYKVEIIAVCTDDGPDGKKARRLIFEWKPSIAVFECWAHQSSLMTGNYLAIKAPWMTDAKESLEVVKWFNGHGKALDLLHAQQMLLFLSILRLILPAVTRWTIHYCCLRRIKKVERAIRACVVTHGETLRLCAGNKPEQIAAAEHIIDTCNRNSFWKNIGRIVNHLEPLAIASNILQSPNCRLDTVLLTLANLFRIFN
ncbi:ribonuclease H-like domain-containing protein, partial [Mycena leptocephala]